MDGQPTGQPLPELTEQQRIAADLARAWRKDNDPFRTFEADAAHLRELDQGAIRTAP